MYDSTAAANCARCPWVAIPSDTLDVREGLSRMGGFDKNLQVRRLFFTKTFRYLESVSHHFYFPA